MQSHQRAGLGRVRGDLMCYAELLPSTSQEYSTTYRHEPNGDRFGHGRHGRIILAIAAHALRKPARSGRRIRRTGGRHFAEAGSMPGAGILESIKPVHVRERDTHCQDKDNNADDPGGQRGFFSVARHRRSFPRVNILTRQTRKQGSCRLSVQQLNFASQCIVIC